jgi:hypothetical protein
MGSLDYVGGKRTCNSSWYLPREKETSKIFMLCCNYEPSCYEEATSHPIWRDVMMEEYQSIMKNDVWDIVLRPKGKSVVTSKWIYNIKHTVNGSIERHKMRFVARGFSQVEGIDYEEKFSSVARYTSIQMIISPTASMGWRVH